MKIYLSPQTPLNSDDRIKYEFEEDVIKVTLPDGTSDVFDFTKFPDGELQLEGENGNSLIDTELTFNVIISARRVNGELSVELVNYIGTDAPEHERFPEWIDHTDYVAPEEKEVNEESGEIDEIISDLSNELDEPDKDNEENETNETDDLDNDNDLSEVKDDGKDDMEE